MSGESMQARCGRCGATFPIEQFGAQKCPSCGTDVMVRDPRGTPAGEEGDRYGRAAAAPLPLPWDRREELGVGRALVQTVKEVVTGPGAAFERLHPEQIGGLHLYVFLVAALPLCVAQLVTWALTDPASQAASIAEARRVLESAGYGQYGPMIESWGLQPSLGALLTGLPFVVLGAFFGFYAFAAGVHGVLWLFGRAAGGWDATRKVVALSFSTLPLVVIPQCGSALGFIGVLVLATIGIARAHRVSGGLSFFAVVGLPVLLTCCSVMSLGMLAGMAAGVLSSGALP